MPYNENASHSLIFRLTKAEQELQQSVVKAEIVTVIIFILRFFLFKEVNILAKEWVQFCSLSLLI
jgi:hypothetical protein